MFLKALEIYGFKSFPDKTRLEFDHGFTAVVGPNGSGKSNLSDAMRWVLGEQSSKSLRGAKMQDVIFGGTQARSPMGFAQVALVIDNADGKLAGIQAEEVTVLRKLYRSGESEYRINGQAVRLKDVHELFMDTGLGKDGYSIISQGKISEIVSAKSEQRREIFEEAAGIAKYRYKKNEAERKLERAEENLLRLRDILQEVESRLEPLRVQSEKASQFLQLAGERRQLEVSLWVYTLAKSRQLLRQQEDKLLLAQRDFETMQQKIDGMDQKNEELYQQMNRCASEIEEVNADIAELGAQINQNEASVLVLQNEQKHAGEEVERHRREMEDLARRGEDIDQKIADKQALIEKSRALAAQREREIVEREETLSGLVVQNSSTQERVEELTSALSGYSVELSEIKVRLHAGADNRARSQAVLQDLGEKRELLTGEMQKAEAERKEVAQQLDQVVEQLTSAQNTKDGYALKWESRQQQHRRAKEELDRLRAACTDAQNKMKVLQDLKDNMEGFAYSVKKVTLSAKEGKLRGILGPVATLLKVERAYATAIEVALGAAAQNIVCQDEGAAKAAIQFLKQQRGGRATFLPLTVIRGRSLSERGLDDWDGYVGVASELVDCDERLRPIAENLLGRTAVVEDLDTAVALAKAFGYRFKVVTLDGQVVNAGGSLTGGSLSKTTGVFSRESELTALREGAAKQQARLAELTGEERELREELARLQAVMEGAQSELITAGQDKIRCEGELARIGQYLEQAGSQLEGLERDALAQRTYLEKLEGEMDALLTEQEQTTALYQKLDGELAALSTSAKAFTDARQAILDEIAEQKMEIAGLQKDTLIWGEEIISLQQTKLGSSQQREEILAQIEAAKARSEKIDRDIAELAEQNSDLMGRIAERRAAIHQISQRRQSLEQEAVQNRQEQKSIQSDKDGVARELARLEERKQTMQQDYDKIVADLYDQYELTRSQAEQEARPLEDEGEAKRRLASLKGKMRALGSVNLDAIEEYRAEKERFSFMSAQIADVEESKNSLHKLIAALTKEMIARFEENFSQINRHFSRIFVDLFGGGKAALSLTDPENVLESGIDIQVAPPGKIINNLQSLSGGEQAFVAIAIYFAILTVHPSPFCILDEIEAALDDVNVNKYAAYLRTMSGETQFICITHRRGTMEEADVLYGVTMQEEGVSKLLKLDVSEVGSEFVN
ncbi:chromosome segregation protein SMC [Bittarella massiliensis]|uniref:chromosome segregation protein SMC n=1 Tax=Bittarella massiliensis (ex Durand et al. 2017) TaxID=1720313 RepID=UPI00163C3B45|nr:chromosome segregation protein SMC [Bittarella massiliensis (ex Durand et al. 2017)]MBC2870332.1 chromosome segregation protein SMC [Bittarella massiliensis (ex Durand et al. 2017)]